MARNPNALEGALKAMEGLPRPSSPLGGALATSLATHAVLDSRDVLTAAQAATLAHTMILNGGTLATVIDNAATALGKLVGTRTAGASSGPSYGYLLNDNTSMLVLPSQHAYGADGEIIDTIGVPPDHQRPLTATDVSTGKDPAMEQAVSLINP